MADSQELRSVENNLYSRMLRNAFIGFAKSAAIAGVIGLGVGALVMTGVGAGLIPAFSIFTPGAGVMVAAFKTALAFAGVCGSFGSVAGIQSTRDARRFLGEHEKERIEARQAAELARSASQSMQMQQDTPEMPTNAFQQRLATENPAQSRAR